MLQLKKRNEYPIVIIVQRCALYHIFFW